MNTMYAEFLESKRIVVPPCGVDCTADDLPDALFPWQRGITAWALRRGRAALFADCGLGKTPMQLTWASRIPGRVLILAPLAVADQTCREGAKFGIAVTHCRGGDDSGGAHIVVTNYEQLQHFDPAQYAGIVLDESSILKAFDGKTRKMLQEFAAAIPYRLACTATPAPNDLIELCNHAEFLDVMSGKEIIALFFKQDGNTTHQWRLKGHARQEFWRWLAQWSVAVRKPSDLGHDDGAFVLPPLRVHNVQVDAPVMDGWLLPVQASTLQERRDARRGSLEDRVTACAGLVNGNVEPWLVWCDLNAESAALAKAIDGACEVKGSDSNEHKEHALSAFSRGDIRVLVTKPSIAGWGMNWQHCARVAFVGLSDSYEQYYQAVRRCWRFGQTRPVECYVITSSADGAVVENIRRKERQASEMFSELVREMSVYEEVVTMQARDEAAYVTDEQNGDGWRMLLGDSCERIREIESDSVGLTVFSPPFPGMYAYTNSARDVGNCRDIEELVAHFAFLMEDLLRVTMPGRMCCVHLTQEPMFKSHDGAVGLRDFRGDVIRAMQDAGWLYFSEVTIDKNPMLKASRTKEATLLFKTLAGDSAGCRPAMADYLLVFRKRGDNPVPIHAGKHKRWNPDAGWITADEWCEWAAPVWYRAMPSAPNANQPWQGNYPSRHQETDGIAETDVLSTRTAKDDKDEKHLCPLQLGVIERCVKLWSAPGDLVLSPFAGIGSEGYQSLMLHRRFVGIELKPSYWSVACDNLRRAEHEAKQADEPLLALMEDSSANPQA